MPRALTLAAALATAALALPRPASAGDPARDAALLARFAPVVLLAPGERALPSSVGWYLARAQVEDRRPARRTAATSLTALAALEQVEALAPPEASRQARVRPAPAARAGSADPRDWIAYGHVYAARDGATLVQYWFFYPFNDMLWAFDHEGDWEHVTVRLDAALRPTGAWLARHDWSAPGKWFAWDALAREGEHPVVLSAHGSHASYASRGDAAWFDRVCPVRAPAEAERAGCRVWRTAAAGVVDTGPRDRPRRGGAFIAWPGRWGATGAFGWSSGGPPGPAFQAGWCAEGAPGCG